MQWQDFFDSLGCNVNFQKTSADCRLTLCELHLLTANGVYCQTLVHIARFLPWIGRSFSY